MSLLQEQSLQLTMTQELRQSIMMLQYNAQELTEFLYEQSLENPLMELKRPHLDKMQRGKGTVDNQIEIYGSKSVTIHQYLHNQLREIVVPSYLQRIVTFLVDSIDENGYLEDSNEELSRMLQIPLEDVNHAVSIIQMLEPAGVGAHSLQECLYLQLKRLQNRCELAEQLIINHFQDFARKDWRRLSRELKVSMLELQQAVDTILALQPKPGLAFSEEVPHYIEPDIVIRKSKDSFIIELQRSFIPKIHIHPDYHLLLQHNTERDLSAYLSQKFHHVQWVLRSIEQRENTLLAVMKAIVKRQEDFFRKGPLYVKPLSLKEIADELHIHESTVSRATRHKYVQTTYGLFEMKYFFSNAIATAEHEGASAKRVKELLRSLVEQENKKKPLSDQKLVDMLKGKYGIFVSRRTVAKYREQLHIPCSSQRKLIG